MAAKPNRIYKDGLENGKTKIIRRAERDFHPRHFGKVRPHQTQNEALVFEKSSPGKRAYKLRCWMCRRWTRRLCWVMRIAKRRGLLPELSEIEIIRHFTRLSRGTMRLIWGCIRWVRAR